MADNEEGFMANNEESSHGRQGSLSGQTMKKVVMAHGEEGFHGG